MTSQLLESVTLNSCQKLNMEERILTRQHSTGGLCSSTAAQEGSRGSEVILFTAMVIDGTFSEFLYAPVNKIEISTTFVNDPSQNPGVMRGSCQKLLMVRRKERLMVVFTTSGVTRVLS